MTTPYDLAVLADAPVSYWRLDEASGTAAADAGSGANAGTYTGGFTLAQPAYDGVSGNAVTLNGTTGYVDCGAAANLNLSRGLTIEALLKTTAAGANQSVFSHGSGGVYLSTIGGVLQFIQSQTAIVLTGITPVNDGRWHHVAATVDSAGNTALFLDGLKDRAGTTAVVFNSAKHATVGCETQTSGALVEFFAGALSRVAVYNSAVSPQRLYAHALAGNFPRRDYPGPFAARPGAPRVPAAWSRGMVSCMPLSGVPGLPAGGIPDVWTGTRRPLAGTPAWASGPWGPCMAVSDSGAGGPVLGQPLAGVAEFTLAALCTLDTLAGGLPGGLRDLWSEDIAGATANMRVYMSTGFGFIAFQMGADGAHPNCQASAPPLGVPVLVTARLTAAGVRSVWYGAAKMGGERTDAGLTYPAAASSGLVLGNSWSGQVHAAYVWNRALADSEIVALAADPFAPARPAPARLGVLVPPPGPVPWLRGATAAPRAARPPRPPASGWAPRLAAAVDLLPWLSRAAAPAPPVAAPRAPLAPWTPASAPAPDPLAWLLRSSPAPAPGVRPPAAPQAGWRPAFAGGPAPPLRHALVRFWRGPEGHMPRLEDGEPAWATDTRSLWVGSATGNVRIGP